jgi:hypothetical protein
MRDVRAMLYEGAMEDERAIRWESARVKGRAEFREGAVQVVRAVRCEGAKGGSEPYQRRGPRTLCEPKETGEPVIAERAAMAERTIRSVRAR